MSMRKARAGRPEASSSVNTHRCWLALWGTHVPNKVKVHSWRIMRNGLAVGSELHRRRIKPGIFCTVCGREESLAHRFWTCPHSRQFWEELSSRREAQVASPPESLQSNAEVGWWMLNWLSVAGDEEREMMLQGVYGLWLARNEARDGNRIQAAQEVATSVSQFMDEWRETVQKKARTRVQAQPEKWKPPEQGWILANADGAVSKGADKGGGGVVLRDHDGAFRGAAAHFFPTIAKPEFVELMACRRALQFGRELGVLKIHVQLDCREAVCMINKPIKNLSAAGPIVEDIKVLMQGWQGCKVTWKRRTANRAAHILAKLAVGEEICQEWHSMPPDCILHVIADEIPNIN